MKSFSKWMFFDVNSHLFLNPNLDEFKVSVCGMVWVKLHPKTR